MATSIDELQIQIQGTAKGANTSINALVKNLDKLQSRISTLDTSKFKNLSVNTINLSNNTNKLSTSLNTLGASATRSTKSFKGLASAFGRFYANFFLVVRGIKGLWNSIESTADYIEAYNYFNVALGKVGSDWSHQFEKYGYENAQAYADSFSERLQKNLGTLSGIAISTDERGNGLLTSTGVKNLGLNIQEITQYASQLASVTNSVGQTGEVSLATANAFTKLGADISSLFNLDYSQVMGNLQSGLIGQSRALYKYGIDITNATLQTYAYELGLEKAVSEMTQAEKMQLRMIAILDQSKVSWGDLANTINSPSNMIRQLSNNMKELGMVLGQLFIPLLKNVIPVLNGLTIALKDLISNIAGFLGIKIDLSEFGQGFSGLEDESEELADSLDDATSSAKKLKNQLQGFDKLNLLTTSNNSGAGSGIGGAMDLTEQILKATEEYERVWNEAYAQMENRAQVFANKIGKIIAPIGDIFKKLFSGDFAGAGADVSNLVVAFNTWLANAIDNVDWEGLGNNIAEFVSGLNWTEILSSFGKVFWEAINAGIELWKGSFEEAPIETTIITALATLKFTGVGSSIVSKIIESLKSGFKAAFSNPVLFATSFVGTPAFDFAGVEILGSIEKAMKKHLPNWANDLIGNLVAGITAGAVGGSWIPGLGTFAGAIIGGILGALTSIKIDGKSIIKTISEKIFNWDVANWLLKDAAKKLNKAFDGNKKSFFEIGGLIISGIVEGLLGYLTIITEPIGDLFTWIWEGICDVFGIHSPAEEMKPLGEYILLGIVEGFKDSFSEFDKSISGFWEDYVKPWFSKDKWTFSGVEGGLKSAWGNAIKSIKEIWNKFAKSINDKLTFKIDPIEIMGKTIFKGITLNLGKIPTFQTGGFPEDGLFFANHNELIGQFSNGQTAVANNEQIVAGIANGVRDANAEQNALLREQNALLRQILQKDMGISTRDIFNAVRTESSDYTRRTGQPAFI